MVPSLLLLLVGWTTASSPSPASPAAAADPDVLQVPAAPTAAVDLPRFVDDLPAIERRGVLRVLVQGHGEDLLPRDGASSREDRDLVQEFAARRGLTVQIVAVRAFDDLVPALLAGTGDVIAGRLTVTKARKAHIAFSRPFRVVDELLVGAVGATGSPSGMPMVNLADAFVRLGERPVALLAGSAHEETWAMLDGPRPPVLRVADERDEHDLASAVAQGVVGATVIDSDVLAHVRAYNPDVAGWATLRKNRELALGLRRQNPALKAALDAFLVERALTAHRADRMRLDLEDLKKRGSIRVLTKNDDISYFLHKGTQRGFDYELVARFAAAHRLRVELVVPPDPADLCGWLKEGRGDVIAALLPAPGCGDQTTASPPYLWPDLLLLQPKTTQQKTQQKTPQTPDSGTSSTALGHDHDRAVSAALSVARVVDREGLRGRVVHVPSSLPDGVIVALRSRAATIGFTIVVDAPVDLLDRADAVASGRLPLSVVSSVDAGMLAGRRDVLVDVVLEHDGPRAWVTHADASQLQRAVAAFVRQHVTIDDDGRVAGSTEYNLLRRAYLPAVAGRSLAATKELSRAASRSAAAISPYDALIQKRAAEAGLDWRLLAAQAYQESRFDPDAHSAVGAQGLFQVMPATGRELGFSNLRDPEQGVAAGAKYMTWLIEQFEPTLPFKHRIRFALAAYNAGKGHVDDARRLARTMGLDADRWFGHVEIAMLRLADAKIARMMRHGYCRGSEPVAYVSQITTRYENYTTLVPLTPSPPGATAR
jgi:membrane-bound lytic murein transglycosylase F